MGYFSSSLFHKHLLEKVLSCFPYSPKPKKDQILPQQSVVSDNREKAFVLKNMATVQLPAYPEFQIVDDPSVAQKWEDWIDGFQAMINAMKVGDDDKHSMLTHYVGTDVRKLMKKLPNPTGENMPTDVYEKAKGKLDEYFAPKMNRVYLMNSLHQVRQNTGETTDSFHIRIQKKLVPLNLDKMTTTELTELTTLSQLVNYCSNNNLRKKALKDGLDLENFLNNARAFERVGQQVKEITQSGDINRIRRNRGKNH